MDKSSECFKDDMITLQLPRFVHRCRRQEVEKGPSSTTRRYNQLEIDGDEDNEELVEKAVHRDREWDDWKDEHPRGSGNKANKII